MSRTISSFYNLMANISVVSIFSSKSLQESE